MQFEYSALLITYNAEDTVLRALEGINQQKIPPTEVIVVDDCSRDSTLEIVKAFVFESPRVSIIEMKQNSGQSVCRNVGIDLAQTAVLMFFDDDDYSLETRSVTHCRNFQAACKLSFVSSIKEYPNGLQVQHSNHDWSGRVSPNPFAEYLLLGKSFEFGSLFIPMSTACIDKATLQSVGGFDADLRRLEDVDLMIRISATQTVMGWSSEIGVIRSATKSSDKGDGIDMIYEKRILQKHKYRLPKGRFKGALIHCEARRLYFSSQRFKLSLFLITHPVYTLGKILRPSPAIRRLCHDVRTSRGSKT